MSGFVDQALRKATRHAKNGEFDLAEEKYRSALEKFPKNARAAGGLKALLRSKAIARADSLDASQPYVTDKMPLNFRWIGFILSAIPEATVVHVTRDPIAICFSNFKQYYPQRAMTLRMICAMWRTTIDATQA
jgi:hypothetical protein